MSDLVTAVYAAEFRTATSATGERILSTRIVPYGEVTYDGPWQEGEEFLPGAFTKSLEERFSSRPLKLFRSHDHGRAIGISTSLEDRRAALFGDFRIASGSMGDETLGEVAEGLLDAVSVGFRAVRTQRGKDGQRQVVEAALLEASLCPLGAYSGAQVLAMREPSVEQLSLATFEVPPMPELDLSRPLYRRA